MENIDAEALYERPITVQIDTTNRCNLSCEYCYNKENSVKGRELNDNEFIKIIEKIIKELNPVRVCFSGGETLLRKELFFKSTKILKDANIDVHINTNGFLIDKDVAQKMRELGVDLVRIALDDIKDLKNTDRFGRSLGEVLDNLSNYFVKENVVIACVIRKSNKDRLFDMASFVKSKGFGTFHLLDLIPCGINGKKEMLEKEDWKEFYKIFSKIKKIGVNIIPNHALLFENNQTKNLVVPFCMAGKYKFIITANGFVVPCNYFKSEKWVCGDARKENLLKIWHESEGILRFRYPKLNNSKCKNCDLNKLCQGGCKALAERMMGDPFGGDPYCIEYNLGNNQDYKY